MEIRGFKKLKDIEMENIKGGWTCPKKRSDVPNKLKTLSYAQKKKYIQFVYENCLVPPK